MLSLFNQNKKRFFFLSLSLFLFLTGFSQEKHYTVADAHAHNDYMHPVPFYTAWNAGFGSIEADVYPVDGVLLVSHTKKALSSERTLNRLYLKPLLEQLKKNDKRKVSLLIDIKENYKESLHLLIQELKPLKKYLVSDDDLNKPVTILISGERPPPAEYKNYPHYIFFDDDLRVFHTPDEWKRVRLVSLSFQRYSHWNGEGNLPDSDRKVLTHVIDSVHSAGKKIRFWAAPDNENSWVTQMKLGADIIGTDKIQELAAFLGKQRDSKSK
ncbi:MAG TPA: phosphatidylinositol-specific phospholipase C/glycerophosphodiester phosphodiesterase family protein [Hanamia sp.]|nr:phosphatidylinositol-specific phospholipase C/glycerophosphodiester phosphodiesterase family protein [Hanamia sp.]